ncbi:MAG: hypothetical protein IPK46_07445 [Saprospiraceae bacterium]|nr:hypothetical protein [Saprospiraceae bacterium]
MNQIIGAVFDILYLITVSLTTLYCFYNFVLALLLLFSKKQHQVKTNSSFKVTIQLLFTTKKCGGQFV